MEQMGGAGGMGGMGGMPGMGGPDFGGDSDDEDEGEGEAVAEDAEASVDGKGKGKAAASVSLRHTPSAWMFDRGMIADVLARRGRVGQQSEKDTRYLRRIRSMNTTCQRGVSL